MYYKILADKTRYFKEDEKGVAAMCKIMEDPINSEKKELKMLRDGKLKKEDIAEYFGLTLEQVEELLRSHDIKAQKWILLRRKESYVQFSIYVS